MKDAIPSQSFLHPLQKRIGRLKAAIFVLFGIIVAMAYVQYQQNQIIKLVAIGTAEALDGVAGQIIKNAEQDDLMRQIAGVDFEQREKKLFDGFGGIDLPAIH